MTKEIDLENLSMNKGQKNIKISDIFVKIILKFLINKMKSTLSI